MLKGKLLFIKNLSRSGKIIAASTACVVVLGLCAVAWAVWGEQKNIAVDIDGVTAQHTTYCHTVGDFLADKNIIVGTNDKVSPDLDAELSDGQTITVRRLAEVDILADGETYHISALDITVGEALAQVGIVLDDDDRVEPSLDTYLQRGMVIDVDRIEVKEETREMELAYSVEKKRDTSMDIHEEKVVTEGVPGKQVETYLVTYSDGEIIDEELINTEITEPVNKVIVTGSYDVASRSGNKSVATGETENTSLYAPNGMEYTEKIQMKATAYTHDGTKTKMGTECRVGAIAVDPDVIPLGTKLYVEGYGYCTAEDTGGKIKGNRIDVFLETEDECVSWGVRSVAVYILK